MNPMDIEQYKKDMMKLYGKRVPSEEVKEVIQAKQPEKPPEQIQEPEHTEEITELEEIPEQEADEENEPDNSKEDDIEERFPEPDLSELESGEDSAPQYVSEEDMGNSTGYILVNVRTGNEAYPIPNASVIITAIVDGNRLIIASGITDISGTTIKLQTPAPDIIYSQAPDPAKRPYSLFDINVKANGYFNARSVDVPVFSGITSIQNFNMIPVPLLMKSSDETLTYFNQEPNL